MSLLTFLVALKLLIQKQPQEGLWDVALSKKRPVFP